MIMEFRKLVFSPSELKSALELLRSERELKLPNGDVVDLVVNDKSDIRARIRMNAYGSSEEHEILVQPTMMGAAMLSYCRKNRIPIPKPAKKSLNKADEGLAMSFTINTKPAVSRNKGGT